MPCTPLVYIKNIWGDLYSMRACRCFCGCMSASLVCTSIWYEHIYVCVSVCVCVCKSRVCSHLRIRTSTVLVWNLGDVWFRCLHFFGENTKARIQWKQMKQSSTLMSCFSAFDVKPTYTSKQTYTHTNTQIHKHTQKTQQQWVISVNSDKLLSCANTPHCQLISGRCH